MTENHYIGRPCTKGHDGVRFKKNYRCVACQRARTNKMNVKKKRHKRRLVTTKLRAIAYLDGKCIDCKWKGHHAGYEFDHINGRGNRKTIGELLGYGWPMIKHELDIGDIKLVCGTCHNIRSWNRLQKEF